MGRKLRLATSETRGGVSAIDGKQIGGILKMDEEREPLMRSDASPMHPEIATTCLGMKGIPNQNGQSAANGMACGFSSSCWAIMHKKLSKQLLKILENDL